MNQKISIVEQLGIAAAKPDRPLAGEPSPAPVMAAGQSVVNPSSITSAKQAATVAQKELAAFGKK